MARTPKTDSTNLVLLNNLAYHIETNLNPQNFESIPLFVDLDGTLIRTDSLLEALWILLRKKWWCAFLLPLWIMRGKTYFKEKLAERVDLDYPYLPYHEAFLQFLRDEKAKGRAIYLISGTHHKFAQKIAEHIGIFNSVYASNHENNLVGNEKVKLIRKLHGGDTHFAYAGNSHIDVDVWQNAQEIIVVNPFWRVSSRTTNFTQKIQIFEDRKNFFYSLFKAMRLHQWVKNSLLFVPILMAHEFDNVRAWSELFWGFLSFSLCASSVYVLNDLLDLANDRRHHEKKFRPFAAGDLPLWVGMLLSPLFLCSALAIAKFLTPQFTPLLLGYYALTLAYSFRLKEQLLLDVMVLSVLYNWRILAGSILTDIPLTPWLLGFSSFFFYSLALAKRAAELSHLKKNNRTVSLGRNYRVEDLPQVMILGIASGITAIVVLALYINSTSVEMLYAHPHFLWPITLGMLYWISRLWMLAGRGEVPQDPILFALKDKISYSVLLFISLLLVLAQIP